VAMISDSDGKLRFLEAMMESYDGGGGGDNGFWGL
jgi:hypothetical protein